MEKQPTTSDYPLLPIGVGDTAEQLFESAAAHSAGDGSIEGVGFASIGAEDGRRTLSSLQARVAEARGGAVRVGRYEVISVIGVGGMGVVYEAINVEHGQRVALKTLPSLAGPALHRLKREFRSLAGVGHPNLCALHELACVDGEWFFTMEHVAGACFADHAQDNAQRNGGRPYLGVTFRVDDRPSVPSGMMDAEPRRTEVVERARAPFHEARLRAALAELAQAVAALHGLGKLHRDLNSANVLVTPEGRVVVLDFGLITDVPRRLGGTNEGISGTPGYMSPEQAAGKEEGTSSDWYAFGVMLFESLTGRLPFNGHRIRVLGSKQRFDAPRASSCAAGVPLDLDDLCAALLRRRPSDRPDASEILRRLGVTRAPPPGWELPKLVGRHDELAALESALRTAGTGRAIAVLLHGAEGVGKTAIGARFTEGLGAGGRALVLRGVVGARESIPHRAFDVLVDALALHLASLPRADAHALLPPEAHDLARVFPVLEAAVSGVPAPPIRAGADEVVRFAFGALAEIVRRISAAGPLVIWIDDIDRADPADLARLSVLCAAAPQRAPLLLLTAADEDAIAVSLAALPAVVRRIRIDPLPPSDARTLAVASLRRAGADAARAPDVARVAEGDPQLIDDLSQWAARDALDAEPVSFASMIEAKLARLPDPALRLLDVLAVARAPIPLAVALGVAGVGAEAPRDAAVDPISIVVRLDAARLVCLRGVGVSDLVSIRDARLRAVIELRLPPAVRRRLHLDLANALARRTTIDPALIAEHLHLGGALDAAAEQACVAAERASAARDFDRAATLYARALSALSPERAEIRAVCVRHAETLAAAGRAVEAARAFLGAAAGASLEDERDLRRRAAEHLLVVGRFDEGLVILRPVLRAHDLRFPDTPRAALFLLGARLVRLRLRGIVPASPDRPVPPSARARTEAAWSAGRGLSSVDPIRSAVFMVEALLSALSVGDPVLVARGLAFVGCLFVYDGGATQEERGNELIEEASRIARRTGDPYLMGFTWCCSGLARMCTGRWREALARMDEGLDVLEASSVGIIWERNAYRSIGNRTLLALGALRERSRRAESWLLEAQERGDRFAETEASLACAFGLLAAGEPARARADVRGVMARFHARAFTIQHYIASWLEASSYLYEGSPSVAWTQLQDTRDALEGSQLLRIQLLRIDNILLRGITAVALAAADEPRADELLVIADEACVRLARERRPHALAAAAIVRAGAAWARADEGRAIDALRVAAGAYDAVEMKIHAACARHTAGALQGGAEGDAVSARADEVLRSEGVVDPARFARMYTGITG
ncbi:Serine/threonine protein kinase [Minicystis rosea]|nr:Serine/threonine protein kinase [Minicystis rosea]